jgi:hypothetical protein
MEVNNTGGEEAKNRNIELILSARGGGGGGGRGSDFCGEKMAKV